MVALLNTMDGKALGLLEKPVPAMLFRVKDMLSQGKKIKIFTARAADPFDVKAIHQWLSDNGLPNLEITNIKDHKMIELFDDRVKHVQLNTGKIIKGGPGSGPRGGTAVLERPGLRPKLVASIRDRNTGEVTRGEPGEFHADIMVRAAGGGEPDESRYDPGFVDQKGNFLTRNEALAAHGIYRSEDINKMSLEDITKILCGDTRRIDMDLKIGLSGEVILGKGCSGMTADEKKWAAIAENKKKMKKGKTIPLPVSHLKEDCKEFEELKAKIDEMEQEDKKVLSGLKKFLGHMKHILKGCSQKSY